MSLEVGQSCPDFALPDETGSTVSLAELTGRPFVLYFYPKDDTSGCTAEAIDFSALREQFDQLHVSVLGVSPDPVAAHGKFRNKYDLTVRLLSDVERSLIEACSLWVQKSMYGRSYMGVERTTALVDASGTVARVWRNVKVPGHASEVLEAARQLQKAE